MDLDDYLNLPCEDVTKEIFDFIIKFSEDESNSTDFKRLWDVNELPELETQKSKSSWEVINSRIENNVLVTDEMNVKSTNSPLGVTYRVA